MLALHGTHSFPQSSEILLFRDFKSQNKYKGHIGCISSTVKLCKAAKNVLRLK